MATVNMIGYEKGLSEIKWKELIKQIRRKNCTPFIGAGACKTLPTGSQLAAEFAKEYNYPLEDNHDLQHVTQYLAITNGTTSFKTDITEKLTSCRYPDFFSPTEPHSLLADLNLPVYITTNYDDFMVQALKKRDRTVKVDFTRWKEILDNKRKKIPSVLFDEEYEPTPEIPLVYHLHGKCEYPASLVVTEEDYLDYLLKISKNGDIIPPVITDSLSSSSLLFIGYSLNDVTLRIILRGLMSNISAQNENRHIAVQIEPTIENASEQEILYACKYLDDYFDAHLHMQIDVYWGKAEKFISELRQHWDQHCKEAKNA